VPTEASSLVGSAVVKMGEAVMDVLVASHGRLHLSEIRGAFKDNGLDESLFNLAMRSLEHRKLVYRKNGWLLFFIPCQGSGCNHPVHPTLENYCWDCGVTTGTVLIECPYCGHVKSGSYCGVKDYEH